MFKAACNIQKYICVSMLRRGKANPNLGNLDPINCKCKQKESKRVSPFVFKENQIIVEITR